MVLLLLAVIWAAVLIPPLLRSRAETSVNDSMGDFHRHLGVLRRTAPATVSPAYRLSSAAAERRQAVASAVTAKSSLMGVLGSQVHGDVQRRRVQVLTVLGASSALTFINALLMASAVAWAVSFLAIGLLVAYIAMLARLKTLAQERAMKLRYLPETNTAKESVSVQSSVN